MITKINGVYSLTDEADIANLPTKGVQIGSLAQLTKDNGDSTVYIFTKDMSTGNTSWVKGSGAGSGLTEDEKANVALIPDIKADIREVNKQLDNIETEKASKWKDLHNISETLLGSYELLWYVSYNLPHSKPLISDLTSLKTVDAQVITELKYVFNSVILVSNA